MTPRARFIAALERRPLTGRVPHFELVFFLTMEAFGRVHPSQRHYSQWNQMQEKERQLHREDMADLYIQTAEKYEHSAICLHPNPGDLEETVRLIDIIRERAGDKYFLMLSIDPTYSIPNGNNMVEFSCQMADDPDGLKATSDKWVVDALAWAEKIHRHGGVDGFALCSDYCFNSGPFMSPDQFGEFVTPYLCRTIQGLRDLNFYTIKHTDGNIMPIIDQLIQANPHALHSLDPQGSVDIAVVKKMYGSKVCLIGNVNCGLLQTGTDEEAVGAVRYSLQHGMPGGGYIFSTSNCVYTGMPLTRYDLMLDVWRKEGNC